MDENAKLTETTLAGSLNIVYLALAQALERGKTIRESQTEGYLMDSLFNVAFLARWIELPVSPLPPHCQYLLKPQFRQRNPPPTVMLGGVSVPEKIHDEFVSIFWHNREEEDDEMLAGMMESWQSNPDPLAGIEMGVQAQRTEEPKENTALSSPDPEIVRRNPAQVLIDGKNDLGITWEKLKSRATKHLQKMADDEASEFEKVTRKLFVELQVDSIFRLLRGRNIRPDNAKALAAVIGVDWKLLVWPVKKAKRNVRAERKKKTNPKVQAKFK